MAADDPDLEGALAEVTAALRGVEARLLDLIRAGAHAATPLDEVMDGLDRLVPEIKVQMRRLQETLERRDLSFDTAARVQDLRRRVLWMYRKTKLEYLFFAKLRFERTSRDALYKQILEMYEELSRLEDAERTLRRRQDDDLVRELLGEEEPQDHQTLSPP